MRDLELGYFSLEEALEIGQKCKELVLKYMTEEEFEKSHSYIGVLPSCFGDEFMKVMMEFLETDNDTFIEFTFEFKLFDKKGVLKDLFKIKKAFTTFKSK